MTEHISAEEISAYLDAEQTEAPRAQIEEHLTSCPECSAESQQLGVAKKLVVRSAQTHTAPPGLVQKAFARIEEEPVSARPVPRARWRGAMVPAFGVLFVAAVIIVSNVYLTPEGWRISCAECQELLPDFIAHSLPPDETYLVAAHLEVCPDCRGVYEEMMHEHRLALTPRGYSLQLDYPSITPSDHRLVPRVAWDEEEPLTP